jgi:hypothetical protein
VSGNLFTPGEVASTPGDQDRPVAAPPGGLRARIARSPFGAARLRAYWLSAPGIAMLIATALAVAVRLFTLSRHGYLTGITEYDDGVYLGGAIRLLEGQLPYHDYAFVQPPGILVLMAPVAFIAKVTTTVKGLALARLITALASAACIPLAGNLIRYRGTVVTAVTCGILAVYPPDISTAHTLMLEPWMNLLCLVAMNAAFRRGHLARPGMLAWAGIAFGFAATVKFWAVAPAAVLLALCLAIKQDRVRRVRAYLIGLVAGFAVSALPFLVAAPVAFVRSTILDQAARTGSSVPLGIRLANLTGLIDVYTNKGRLTLNAGAHSMFAAGTSAGISTGASLGWLPIFAALTVVALIAVGYARQSRRLTPLELLALVTAVIAIVAITGYSAFFYHYADFPAPWIALTLGSAAGALATPRSRTWVLRALAVFIALVAVLQVREMFPLRQSTAQVASHLIPSGSCVVSDEASLVIAADRFVGMRPGCPDIIDALAATLVVSHGVSVQGGASTRPDVVAQWKTWLGDADYVWLSPAHGSRRRIPWTPALSDWFNANFVKVGVYSRGTGQIYQNIHRASATGT